MQLRTTADLLSPTFFQRLQTGLTENLEIETYSFDVLPEPLRHQGVVESLVQEYQWVLARVS